MKNKIMILLAVLTIASCSSNKEVAQTPEPVVQPVIAEVPVPVEPAPVVMEEPKPEPKPEIAIYSISDKEKSTSEIKPFVVYFDTNKFNIREDAAATLNDMVLPEAKNTKTKRIVIEAHCDERGSKVYNQGLSERRANAVKNYLVKNGIKASTIKTIGYGKTKPVAEGHNEEAWSQNRRAVTVIIKR